MNSIRFFGPQQYDQYTVEDLEVWTTLYNKQINILNRSAYRHFPGLLKKLKLNAESIPDFKKTNELLEKLTYWNIYGIPGPLPNRRLFRFMIFKRFGVSAWMRNKQHVGSWEWQDMFHDVFGHVPLLADPVIASYLTGLARIAERYIHQEDAMDTIWRLYWFTFKHGLVREGRDLKIYGGAILSSYEASRFVLSPIANCQTFDLNQVLDTPVSPGKYQDRYFILDSLGQLKGIVKEFDHLLRTRYQ